MKILLTGDLQFGRDYWDIDKDCPTDLLRNMIPIFNKADLIIFNLESVIAGANAIREEDKIRHKPYHILSTPQQLHYLRSITNKPIIVATINNHTFDFGVKGYKQTLTMLKQAGFLFTYGYNYLPYRDIAFFDATTHWTELESLKRRHEHINKIWDKNCWVIDMNNNKSINHAKNIIGDVRSRNPNKIIIFCIHWGKNWVDERYVDLNKEEIFAKSLIEHGCNIVFGSGAHHVVDKPYQLYQDGIIIYGLGDLSGDFIVKSDYNSPKSLSLIYDTKQRKIDKIPLSKVFNSQGCGAPIR